AASRPMRTSRAPWRASSMAVARPSPDEAPVTTTQRPSKSRNDRRSGMWRASAEGGQGRLRKGPSFGVTARIAQAARRNGPPASPDHGGSRAGGLGQVAHVVEILAAPGHLEHAVDGVAHLDKLDARRADAPLIDQAARAQRLFEDRKAPAPDRLGREHV